MDKTKKIAYSGLIVAITLIILYLGIITVKSKISFLSLASFALAVPIILFDIKTGIVVALAADIIAFLIIPRPIYVMIFIPMSFYPAVKAFIESRMNFKWVFKYIYFNIVFFAIFFIHKLVIFNKVDLKSSTLILIIVLSQVIFYIYDFAFTKVVSFFINKINRAV